MTQFYYFSYQDLVNSLARFLPSKTALAAAAIATRINYWLNNDKSGCITLDGHKWIYNSYKQWQEQFSWLSVFQFGRIIRALEKIGLVISAKYSQLVKLGIASTTVRFRCDDQSKWYRLNTELFELFHQPLETAPRANVQFCNTASCDSATLQCAVLQHSTIKDIERDPKNNNSVVEEKESNQEVVLNFSSTNTPEEVIDEFRVIEKNNSPGAVEQIINKDYRKHLDDLDSLGVPLNPTLTRFVKVTEASLVVAAIEAYKLYKRDHHVKNPSGFIVKALQDGFKPVGDSNPNSQAYFLLWFDLAKSLGLYRAWEIRDGHTYVRDHNYFEERGWFKFSDLVASGLTLEYLQKRLEKP